MITTTFKTDKVGIIASTLCMLHCIVTPSIFLVASYSEIFNESTLYWWSSLDYIFLLVSSFAIYKSTKKTSKIGMKYAMWISWIFLLTLLLNEKLQLFSLFESAIYFPAMSLVILHFRNLKNIQSETDSFRTT